MTKKEKIVKMPVVQMSMKEKWENFWDRNRKSEGYLLKKKSKSFVYRLCRGILVFGLCFLILQPLLNKLSLSFMEEQDLYDSTVVNIPRHFSIIAYQLAWEMMTGIKSFWTSFYVAFLVACAQIISCTLVGYGFARFKFPFKKFWFACVILMIIVPPQTFFVTLYLWFRDFDIFGVVTAIKGEGINLYGSIWPYLLMCFTCVGFKGGLYIYMLRQHFRNEPKELEEAAYVDGCSRFRTFIQIMLPGATPILTSCFLFAFVWQWTDSIYSKLFFPKATGWIMVPNSLSALPNVLDSHYKTIYGQAYQITQAFGQQVQSTAVLMTLIPLLIIYIVAQKNFVESLSQTGIKG